MITYADILPHLDGNTPAQIADILNADPRHKRDIMATSSKPNQTDLLDLLGLQFGMLRLSKNATWKGPLIDYFDANSDSPMLAGFELLLTQLQINERQVRCHSIPAVGALATGIINICKSLHNDPEAVQAAMDALTGGKMYSGVTPQEVQALLNEQKYETKRVAAENDLINPAQAVIDGATDVASLTAAYRALASALNTAAIQVEA